MLLNAMVYMGLCYKDGKGIAKNHAKAFELFQKSAYLKNSMGMYYLGYCYEHGIGVKANITQAVRWYEKASKKY